LISPLWHVDGVDVATRFDAESRTCGTFRRVLGGRDVNKVASVELEGRLGTEEVQVDFGFWMVQAHEAVEFGVASVEGAFRIRCVMDEAVVDERLFGAQSDCLVGLNSWEVLDGTSGHRRIIGHKMLGGTEGSLGPCYAVRSAEVEVAISQSVCTLFTPPVCAYL
jgi:hypothetical protein